MNQNDSSGSILTFATLSLQVEAIVRINPLVLTHCTSEMLKHGATGLTE